MPFDFSNKHPLYTQSRSLRTRALDFYEGGSRVEGNFQYLVRHPYETDRQYQIRIERATYRNYAAPIVDVFASYICDRRPERTLPGDLLPMLPDVDRKQNNADVFFGNQARMAAAGGVRFVLCDMERSVGKSRYEDLLAGRRELPYLVAIDPDDVYDWSLDDKGLAWCVLHGVEPVQSRPFEGHQARDTLTVWSREGWQRYRGQPRSMALGLQEDLTSMYLEAEGEHRLGEVPLVPFLFEPVTAMTGNAATDDVLSLILRVYRRDSELDKMLFDCAVPLAIINGLDPEEKDAFIRSSSNILVSSEPGGVAGTYLEPGGTSFAALRDALASDIQSIREIALRMVRPDTAQAISAESKSIDKQQLDTQLANFARRCANAERKCFELAYKWLHNGAQPPENSIETPYNEDYSLDLDEKLDGSFALQMYTSNVISQETCLQLMKKVGLLDADFDVDDALASMSRQIKDSAGPAGVERAGRSLLELAEQTRP